MRIDRFLEVLGLKERQGLDSGFKAFVVKLRHSIQAFLVTREIARSPGKNVLIGNQITERIPEVIVEIYLRCADARLFILTCLNRERIIRNSGVHCGLGIDRAFTGYINTVDDRVGKKDTVILLSVNGIRSSGYRKENRCCQQYFLSCGRTALRRFLGLFKRQKRRGGFSKRQIFRYAFRCLFRRFVLLRFDIEVILLGFRLQSAPNGLGLFPLGSVRFHARRM